MLSCLSPRSPCCGPNAATSRISPGAASASRECLRSRVTEAGCASNATLRPARGRRRLGSASNRSIPNFIEFQGERIGVMEIRPARRVPEGPVGKPAVPIFDYRGHGERELRRVMQRRYAIKAYQGAELKLVCGFARGHLWNQRQLPRGGERPALAIARERVRRPGPRGREIEFMVRSLPMARDEYLAAGMPPKLLAEVRRRRRRN